MEIELILEWVYLHMESKNLTGLMLVTMILDKFDPSPESNSSQLVL